MATRTREDVYSRVTQTIVSQLEAGIRPWMQPWQAGHAAGPVCRPLRFNGKPYQGINILMLWAAAGEHGFSCPIWITFQQARELGGHVRKGEKASPVVFASSFRKTEEDDNGQEIDREIPFLKQYSVFNAEQCEGLPAHFYATKEKPGSAVQPIEQAQCFFRNTGADIREGGDRAFYTLEADYIRLPSINAFRDAESHAATLAHELIHWTRHESRLARDLGRKRFADAGYAMEELVAELGSAFLCADLEITPEIRPDHADYIGNWLTVLKNDNRAIFTASSLASQAAGYLHGLQPNAV